jgi:hypothetical protein
MAIIARIFYHFFSILFDKIRGKSVKYRLGDCLTIKLPDGKYLGALMTGKFNKYYNFTFMDFLMDTKPELKDFESAQFFGTRIGSWEDLTYAFEQQMVLCKDTDENENIEKAGAVSLIPKYTSVGYSYLENIDEMYKYYLQELPVRIEKTKNAERFPAIAFASRHLIFMEKVKSLKVVTISIMVLFWSCSTKPSELPKETVGVQPSKQSEVVPPLPTSVKRDSINLSQPFQKS